MYLLHNREIIIDFQITNHYNCPQDYEEYTSYTWPGNTEGCLCSTSVGLWNYEIVLQVVSNLSRANAARQSLREIAPQLPKATKSRIPSGNPRSISASKRLKNYNFYSSEQQIINPHSFPAKHCGFQQDHQIDLISVIDCPVTTLTNHSNLTNLLGEIGFSFEREDHYPIVDFKIAEEQFC